MAAHLADHSLWHGKAISYSYKNTTQGYLATVAQSLALGTTGSKGQLWDSVTAEIDRIYEAHGWTHKLILRNIRIGKPFDLQQRKYVGG